MTAMSFNDNDARNRVLVGYTMFKMQYKQEINLCCSGDALHALN